MNNIQIIPAASDLWASLTHHEAEQEPRLWPVIGWAISPDNVGDGGIILGTDNGYTVLGVEYCEEDSLGLLIGTREEASARFEAAWERYERLAAASRASDTEGEYVSAESLAASLASDTEEAQR